MEDQIAAQLLDLARGTQYGLDAFLKEIAETFTIDGTAVTLRTYHVALDGKGLPRTSDLHKALARHTLDYAIPRSKINEAYREFSETKSTAKLVALADESRSLFTTLAKTGEGGELLLFAFCEQVLGLPLVIAKMNLKTDTEMHFHGADGVYAGLTDEGKLALYWGESKIYKDRSEAANDCFESVSKLLLPSNGVNEEEDRDLELLRDYSDLGDPNLTKTFRSWLEKDNPIYNDVDFRAVCLIGFEHDSYPSEPKQMQSDDLRNRIKPHVKAFAATVGYYVKKYKLTSFELISVCVPLPSADKFREQFLEIVVGKKDSFK